MLEARPLARSRAVRSVPRPWRWAAAGARATLLAAGWLGFVAGVNATTPLADQPLFTNTAVPGNLALALSVEFPTAISVAHTGAFVPGKLYEGYFDSRKCYRYHVGTQDTPASSPGPDVSHFFPVGKASADYRCTGTGLVDTWSGNFMNWMIMQAIDPFRMVLTGGYRVIDEVDRTILEKAWGSNQGSDNNFPNIPRTTGSATQQRPSPSAAVIADHTPLGFGSIRVSVRTHGNQVRFTETGDLNAAPTHYDPATALIGATTYSFYARVRVCQQTISGLTLDEALEPNCKAYSSGYWKPEGLLQQYSDRMRYSAFGYLNDSNVNRDGGVLRARQKFIGPQQPVPGAPPVVNPNAEWSASTGVFVTNPDSADASSTATAWGITVGNSGVANYVNKFGQIVPGTYKTYDPVGELYYAALRYLRGLGNVPAWTNPATADAGVRATRADGFPVITDWGDPIQYSCQRNFVLGIGDVNTHADKNVPGPTGTANEPSKPAEVIADTGVDAVLWSNKVGSLHGHNANLGTTYPYNGCCTNNSALMAGLAYHANTTDVRPDLPGKQTIQTYWLDVLEFQQYKTNNQFYLAAKFGGMQVPDSFDPLGFAGPIPDEWWYSTTDTVGTGGSTQKRPDNYFVAARPDQVIDGLTQAFAQIAAQLKAYTTSFSTSLPQVSIAGNASYSAQFDSENWTGELVASELSFDPVDGTPSQSTQWSFSAKLNAQLAGTGWDLSRRVVTWNPEVGAGRPLRHGEISAAQRVALNTPYRGIDDSADYLNYLRGQRLHETGSTEAGSSQAYRKRSSLLADIVGSKARPVGPPSLPYSNASNPGYGAFRAAHAGRPTVVYVGANDGKLHAVDGRLTGADAGKEIFAYVPSALFNGPGATPAVNGLAALGNPDYEHRNYVNATPAAFDIDFGKTVGGSGTNWRSVLIGGLGKGGRSWYAIDITDPGTMTSEAAVASRVLWEFSDPDMGYTFGEPLVVKTKKYGWVVLLGSGYNNLDGKGYLFIVNPRTGALLEKLATGTGTAAAQAGMAHINAFALDRTDGTVDAAYAGDLLGNVWRFDLRGDTGFYPAPVKLAELRNAANEPQPVTTRPLIEVDARTNRRFVLLGTGRMLDTTDIGSPVQQAFYAIVDGTGTRFNALSHLPTGISFPIQRSNLADNTDLLDGISYDLDTQIGWYVELGTGGGAGLGWRVVNDPSSAFGIVVFASTLPSGDACNPTGSTRIYAIDFGTGKSVLTSGATYINYSTALASVVTDLRFFSVNGVPRLIAGSDTGELGSIPGAFGTRGGVRRLNWRELPTAN